MLGEQDKIACMMAVYESNMGNCSKIIFQSGKEILLKQSVDSALRAIAKHYAIDINELKKKQRSLLNSKNYIPLPIHKDMLFICIKTRLPKIKKDPSVSYINFYEIDRLDKKASLIYMKNGQEVECLNSIKTLKKRYNQGEICAKIKNDEQKQILRVDEDPVMSFYPATRGDIKVIAREIESLRELLRSILVSK